MESRLVNSMLVSVCRDFSLNEEPAEARPSSPTGSVTSSATTSGYSSPSFLWEPEGEPQEQPKKAMGDILDLYTNLTRTDRWAYRPAVLPPRDIKAYLANRSVYHRCYGFEMVISGVEVCPHCQFSVPVVLW